MSNLSATSWREQVIFNRNGSDGVQCVLSQHAELDLYSASSSLKQQSAGRHIAPIGHNIVIPSQPIFTLFLKAVCFAEKQQIPISL
jgi:hypothetical protein